MLKEYDQVAGHEGVLKGEDGVLIKPCKQHEINVYEVILPKLSLSKFAPTYMGSLAQSGDDQQEQTLALVLEDLECFFKKPCVIDVKLGKILASPKASEEKRKRLAQVADSTTSGSLGFRVAGMKVSKPKISKTNENENKITPNPSTQSSNSK